MRLRPARREDHVRIVAVQPAWWGGRDLTALLQPLFLDHFASSSLVVEDEDDQLVAFLIGFRSADHPDEAYVHFVGVSPYHRGLGVGRTIHQEFSEQMAARGVQRIRCVTSPVNTASVAFHEAIGFVVDGVGDQHVHLVRAVSAPSRFVPRADPRPDDDPWPGVEWPVGPGTVLEGWGVSLAPASEADAGDLFAALDHDAVWTHVRGRPATVADLATQLAGAPAAGRFPWVVRREGMVVGTTSFLEVSPVDARLEIGFTLYAPDAWGSVVNPACKLLLMDWAFGHGFGRVQLKTDVRNVRSQQAIARLGARYEGVLRRYQRRQDGSVRDTVVFSVVAEDWLAVRDGLLTRLG